MDKWVTESLKLKTRRPVTYLHGMPIYETGWYDIGLSSMSLKGKKYLTYIGLDIVYSVMSINTAVSNLRYSGIKEVIKIKRRKAIDELEVKVRDILQSNRQKERANKFTKSRITHEDIIADAPEEILVTTKGNKNEEN